MFVLLDENNVVIQKQPNDAEGFVPAPFDVVCGQIFDGESFVSAPSNIESLKAERRRDLDKLYYQKIEDGFDFGGNTFQIDDNARLNMTAVMTDFALGATNPHGGFWRSADNQMIAMTDAEVQAFIWAVKAYVLNMLQTYWTHKDAISVLETGTAVEVYDFNTGWPS